MKKLANRFEFVNELLINSGFTTRHPYYNVEYNEDHKGYIVFNTPRATYKWFFTIPGLFEVEILNANGLSSQQLMAISRDVQKLKTLMTEDFAETFNQLEVMAQRYNVSHGSECDCGQVDKNGDLDFDCTYYPALFSTGDHVEGGVVCAICKEDGEQLVSGIVHRLVKEYNKIPSKYEIIQEIRKVRDNDKFINDCLFHYMIGLVQSSEANGSL